MMKITLFCNAGMSTSMLVKKMQKAAKDKGMEDVCIEAYPEAELEAQLEKGVSVVLLGPQIKFLLEKIKSICEPKGVPVDVINSVDYGMMNGAKVLEHALKLAKQ
ncbi:PTS sugar transporter subunit IIB [Clostridium sp. cel8]|uniref:PTS sugar transporter subunit IIB n=1 Tax=unclassified Clostridium TaxID=2614128 RepID=UPI0015F3766B|nr:PTS sugar transporter subunit IIB [Clostridium sp. cel8]